MDYEDHVFKETENTTAPFLDIEQQPAQDYLDVVLTIVGILGIIVNAFLIYMICYFRKLHTSTNMYLINWSIANMGAVIMTLCCFQIYSTFVGFSYTTACFYLSLVFALYFNTIFFMLMITTDWWFSAFWPAPLSKFREFTKCIIALVWILSSIYFVVSAVLCSTSTYYLVFHYSLPVMFTVLLTLVIGLHLVRFIKKCRVAFEYHPVHLLYAPTAFVCCWFLSWVNMFVPYSFICSSLSDFVMFLHPICNFILLVTLDKDFKTCFIKVIDFMPCKCFRRKEELDNTFISQST